MSSSQTSGMSPAHPEHPLVLAVPVHQVPDLDPLVSHELGTIYGIPSGKRHNKWC